MGWRLLAWLWRTEPEASQGAILLDARQLASVTLRTTRIGGGMAIGLGNVARLTANFRTGSGSSDPTTVRLKIQTPAGVESELSYPTGIVRDGAGAYHYDLSLLEAGTYRIRWVGGGAVVAAAESSLAVPASPFASPL